MNEELYNSRVSAGKRTYFLNVKKASNGSLYLDIAESRRISENNFERHNIMIWPEDFGKLKEEILKIYYKFFDE